jgi:D-galactose 1-dehydrogenase
MTIRIALIGFGKIAKDEHLPAIMQSNDYELVAIVAHGSLPDISCAIFQNAAEMFAAMPGEIDAVAICTPPAPRFAIAAEAIAAGVAILLEKPPTATLGELDDLIQLAAAQDTPLYTAWHSQYAAGVADAACALADEEIAGFSLIWREDVRKFHSGQQWIWDAGGFGVFDPGVNGLSILTRILPEPLLVCEALLLFPGNRQAPIAANMAFHGQDRTGVMDWREGAHEQWSVHVETRSGKMVDLRRGGAELAIDGTKQELAAHNEYRAIYAEFADVIKTRRSNVDREPLRIVADCFLIGERKMVEDFV